MTTYSKDSRVKNSRMVRYECPVCSVVEVFGKPGLNLSCMNCRVGLCREGRDLSEMKKLRLAAYETQRTSER